MKFFVAFATFASILSFGLMTAVGPALGQPPPRVPPDVKTLAEGNSEFAFDLCKRLPEKEGNVVFSPYSISTALAMAYGGARGETAAQMAKAMHFTLEPDRLHPAFGQLIASLQTDGKGPLQLYTANSAWCQQGFPFEKSFLHLTEKNYHAQIKDVDFVRDPDNVRKAINRWVDEKTKEKVKEIVRPGAVTPQTRLVLANAVYFKGRWETPFPKELTKKAPFAVTKSKKVDVAMMSMKKGAFEYSESDDFQWLELPYQGGRLAMIVALPRQQGRLAELEKKVTPAVLQKAIDSFAGHDGPVSLPRFKFTSEFELVEALDALGMPLPFSVSADFSGISPVKGLRISSVAHKAFIDLDEAGTEAAAATVVFLTLGRRGQFSFTADHPFLFFLRDRATGCILFQGRVTDPSQ